MPSAFALTQTADASLDDEARRPWSTTHTTDAVR
jgi:hypothetical protein